MPKTDKERETLTLTVETACAAIGDKLGTDITVLDIAPLSPVADFFIIATARNQNQLRAIADTVEEKLLENGVKLKHAEGYPGNKWILMDFGAIIIHLFTESERVFYNLERVWGDARRVSPVKRE